MKKKILIPVLAALIFFTTVGFKQDFFEIAKQIEIFTTLFKDLNMNYVDETTPAELMEKAINGILDDLDPYTQYYNEQDVEAVRINRAGEHAGIGARTQIIDHKIIIIEPWKDYPADKAGLKAGDEIIKIGNISLSDFDDNSIELLNGAPGSTVSISYNRQGKIHNTSLVREAKEVHAVPFYTLVNDQTGYIVLSKFNRRTTLETKAALIALKEQGAKNIILDLRGNPGGLLSEAINIVNLFVPKDQIITFTKSAIKKYNKIYRTRQEPTDTEIPLVVLINGRSASASEIVSGSLQDLDRAVIIGARSFGKGLVQRPKELTYGTQFKVTISRYYTPSGRCIQALDYWNRDENGDPLRLDPKDYNAFKTKNGRTVYDGGGILPDIELETAAYSPVTTALLRDHAIFNFATHYYYKNPNLKPEDFIFSNSDFNTFMRYLKSQNFDYETQSEKIFEKAFRKAKDDHLDTKIKNSYTALMADIVKAKEETLIKKKEQIKSLLSDEIVKRLAYKEGLYEYQIKNNLEILEALTLLQNQKKYSNILK